MARVGRSEGGPAPAWLADPLTRRAFLARAAALGMSVAGLSAIVQACRSALPSISAAPGTWTAFAGLPIVEPPPASATYGELLPTTELAIVSVPSDSLRSLVNEIASDAGLPVVQSAVAGRRQARLSVEAGLRAFDAQAYHLDVAPGADGPVVKIGSGDEAGAFYGLLSLGQLVAKSARGMAIRAATIDDGPGFLFRGAILDPAPKTGVPTAAERDQLIERVRLGVRYRFNFLFLPGRTPWPALVRYCTDHHVEIMVGWGYKDWLNTTPRQRLKTDLAAQVAAGANGISLAWDDLSMRTADPESLARLHSEAFTDLYSYLRSIDPAIPIATVLPPYGGVPGRNLIAGPSGRGERYLAAMRDALPDDVRVFWTGDGGVFSDRITAAGARAYGDAIGHEVAIWDNNAISNSRARKPLTGRDADLASVVRTYMGNLAGEAVWTGTDAEIALLTSLFYTWNPARYDPTGAAAEAERALAGRGSQLPAPG